MKWLNNLRRIGNSDTRKPRAETSTPIHAGPVQDPASVESRVVSKLSPREKEVFQRLLTGAKMRDIAHELGVKTSTVNGYCAQIYKTLGVNSKAQLILRYFNYQDNRGQKGDG